MRALVHKALLIHVSQHIYGVSSGPLWRYELPFCLSVVTFACTGLLSMFGLNVDHLDAVKVNMVSKVN